MRILSSRVERENHTVRANGESGTFTIRVVATFAPDLKRGVPAFVQRAREEERTVLDYSTRCEETVHALADILSSPGGMNALPLLASLHSTADDAAAAILEVLQDAAATVDRTEIGRKLAAKGGYVPFPIGVSAEIHTGPSFGVLEVVVTAIVDGDAVEVTRITTDDLGFARVAVNGISDDRSLEMMQQLAYGAAGEGLGEGTPEEKRAASLAEAVKLWAAQIQTTAENVKRMMDDPAMVDAYESVMGKDR